MDTKELQAQLKATQAAHTDVDAAEKARLAVEQAAAKQTATKAEILERIQALSPEDAASLRALLGVKSVSATKNPALRHLSTMAVVEHCNTALKGQKLHMKLFLGTEELGDWTLGTNGDQSGVFADHSRASTPEKTHAVRSGAEVQHLIGDFVCKVSCGVQVNR